jgi:16S rRNA pseudouridine516 synthase
MRLDRFTCKSTDLTKAEAIKAIHSGEVSVNGQVISCEKKQVNENNEVTLNGNVLKPRPFRYLMMHKAMDSICSNVDEGYPSIFKHIDIEKVSELHIVGRLDVDTTGLVLISDDGSWTYDIITPSRDCSKLYRVGLSRPIPEDAIEKFKQGLQLQGEDQVTRPAKLEIITPQEVLLTLTEGKFHQVKRMFRAIGNRVTSLHREKIGDITLDTEIGKWRHLTSHEVDSLKPSK